MQDFQATNHLLEGGIASPVAQSVHDDIAPLAAAFDGGHGVGRGLAEIVVAVPQERSLPDSLFDFPRQKTDNRRQADAETVIEVDAIGAGLDCKATEINHRLNRSASRIRRADADAQPLALGMADSLGQARIELVFRQGLAPGRPDHSGRPAAQKGDSVRAAVADHIDPLNPGPETHADEGARRRNSCPVKGVGHGPRFVQRISPEHLDLGHADVLEPPRNLDPGLHAEDDARRLLAFPQRDILDTDAPGHAGALRRQFRIVVCGRRIILARRVPGG